MSIKGYVNIDASDASSVREKKASFFEKGKNFRKNFNILHNIFFKFFKRPIRKFKENWKRFTKGKKFSLIGLTQSNKAAMI